MTPQEDPVASRASLTLTETGKGTLRFQGPELRVGHEIALPEGMLHDRLVVLERGSPFPLAARISGSGLYQPIADLTDWAWYLRLEILTLKGAY